MKSRVTAGFWKHYDRLPKHVQEQADLAYRLWVNNHYHPSLQFKRVDPQTPIYSVRVGRAYRALGKLEDNTIVWYWIGGHDEYDRLLR
jgi:hypothetical protein